MWVVLQAAVNIGAMVGILPLTGITLPFISYGGSSMLAISIGIGIMLNISRQRV
jgi:cell division protein FtsW